MKINFSHNFDQLFKKFDNFGSILQAKAGATFRDQTLAGEVRAAIDSELATLGLASRAYALKKSFKILAPEIGSNGIIYRIRSTSPQLARLNTGAAPDARYTLGAKKMADGSYSGVMPTRIIDKIQQKVNKILYDRITSAINSAFAESGF